MSGVERLLWPATRLDEALERLARASGLGSGSTDSPHAARGAPERTPVAAAERIGLEAERTVIGAGELAAALPGLGPAIVRWPGPSDAFLALLPGGGDRVHVLAPEGRLATVSPATVASGLTCELERAIAHDLDALLDRTALSGGARARARVALTGEWLADARFEDAWLVRVPATAPFRRHAAALGMPRRAAGVLLAHVMQYVTWIASWWAIGRGALTGRIEPGWIVAWALLLATLVPLRALVTRLQGRLAIDTGALLKQRLLEGALRLDAEDVRRMGAGQLLGRVLESEAVEELTLSAGAIGLMALIELLVATLVVASAGRPLLALLLCAWTAATLALAGVYRARRSAWTQTRLALTDGLIERMVGHRTRLAQERPERWHAGEDEGLEQYLERSTHMDRAGAVLAALAPRGWLVLGVLGLAATFVRGPGGAAFAVAVGGVLLGHRALEKLAAGLASLVDAWIAWGQVRPLFEAASRRLPGEQQGSPPDEHAARSAAAAPGSPVIEAAGVGFSYAGRRQPVLSGCSVQITSGERVLLSGASGGGKSTLVSLLAGLRQADAGLVLAHGIDLQTLGADAWRRVVAVAPQFHENHVLTETLAFNLLMGRRWPPRQEDMLEAEAVCRELGLGPLLERMPAGLLQTVGDTGWQLSHGERSRVFMARALLQDADVVVLDESFAALDPLSLEQAIQCVLRRAPAVLAVAHA